MNSSDPTKRNLPSKRTEGAVPTALDRYLAATKRNSIFLGGVIPLTMVLIYWLSGYIDSLGIHIGTLDARNSLFVVMLSLLMCVALVFSLVGASPLCFALAGLNTWAIACANILLRFQHSAGFNRGPYFANQLNSYAIIARRMEDFTLAEQWNLEALQAVLEYREYAVYLKIKPMKERKRQLALAQLPRMLRQCSVVESAAHIGIARTYMALQRNEDALISCENARRAIQDSAATDSGRLITDVPVTENIEIGAVVSLVGAVAASKSPLELDGKDVGEKLNEIDSLTAEIKRSAKARG